MATAAAMGWFADAAAVPRQRREAADEVSRFSNTYTAHDLIC